MDRWRQIDRILEDALEREPGHRTAFLDEACAGDEALRREAESLLAAHDRAGSFIESPPTDLAAEALGAAEARLAPGQIIGRYEILRELGRGGMGEVYLAQDSELGRKVALKLLPLSFAGNEERVRRFKREARAASALNHPNIITIYEVGGLDDFHFIISEFVDGETLASRIDRGPIPIEETLAIARQVVAALSEAHLAGIVHRDIKPQNIMINARGQVKVLDFGLAKMASRAPAGGSEATTQSLLTEPGLIIGTVAYMSPEQLRGEALDTRTDIFSFGSTLYEMVTGKQPFASESTAETISAILTRDPLPFAEYVQNPSPALEGIVLRCLEKDPLKRYQKTVDVAIDLDRFLSGREPITIAGASLSSTNAAIASRNTRRIAFGRRRAWVAVGLSLLVFAALAAAVVRFLVFRGATPARPPIKSLAVLPLDNFSGDPAQDYFADGMTEALISSLSQIRELRIVSRTSVMRFKGSAKPLQEIARELNVDAVIEGSVQRADGRVKVTTQLINAATDAHIWARDYERQMTDILRLQGEVARAIADEIRIQVTPEERARLASARPVAPAAHEAYLLGRYHFWKLKEEDLQRAIEYFEQATRLAPDYAAAYAGLSDAWRERGIWGEKSFAEVESASRAAAKRALELDDSLASAHVSQCHIKFGYDWDWTGAEEEIKRALELDPGDSDAHHSFGNLLQALGRFPAAIAQMEIAEHLDPLSSAIQSTFGRVLYRAGQYPEAVMHLNRAIELDPGNYGAYGRLGDVYEEMGRYDEARAAYESAQAIGNSGARGYRARLARMYARAGKPEQALRIIEDLKTGTGSAELPLLQMAAAYAALGNKDEAFRLLTRAIEQHDSLTVFIKEDPPFQSLRSDRRWTDLLRRMNLPPE